MPTDQPPHVPPYQPAAEREAESIGALLDELAAVRTVPDRVGQFSAAARVGRKIAAHPDITNTPLPRNGGTR